MSIITIIPALIPKSLADISSTLKMISSFSRELQVDVVDGHFVENISWPYGQGEMKGLPSDIAPHTMECDIEMDLMIHNPLEELPKWLRAGVKRAVVHMESCSDLARARDIAHEYGALLGIASQNHTPVEEYMRALRYADYAQCMGIPKIGVQGQPFDRRVLARIASIRIQYPDMEIAVDGSVNEATIDALVRAGATRLVSGSAIVKADDPRAAYERLYTQAQKAITD